MSPFEASERNGAIDAKEFRPKSLDGRMDDKLSSEDEATLAGMPPF
jgi:hypothetical protein